MPYDKYIKIRNSGNGRQSVNSGIKKVNRYDDNDEKTVTPTPAVDDPYEKTRTKLDAEPAQDSIQFLNDYAENETKTINPESYQRLVSVINSESRDTFVRDCIAAEQLYHSHKDERLYGAKCAVEAYHIISSCKGTNLDPWMVHHAGCDLAKALAGDEYAVKICTHLNTNNYHNHIIINAYANDGNHKFRDEYHLYKKIRTISNEIALRYGFEIIMPGKSDKKNWAEYLGDKVDFETMKSTNAEVKKDIRDCTKNAKSYEEFETLMENLGYELAHNGKRTTYVREGTVVSDYALGSRYSASAIEEEISKQSLQNVQRKIAHQAAVQAKNYTVTENFDHVYVSKYDEYGNRRSLLIRFLLLIKKYIELMQDKYLDEMTRSMFPDNIRVQSANQKLQALDKAIGILEKYDIQTLAGLNDKLRQIGMNGAIADNKAAKLLETADNMEDMVHLLQMEDYMKTMMNSLGITEEQFNLPSFTETDTLAAYAAMDPVTGTQKKQLWNALKDSGYRIRTGGFTTLSRTQADEILKFLNGKTEQPPDILLSEETYRKERAEKFIRQKAIERAKNMHKRYGNTPATLRQKKALTSEEYSGNIDNLNKAEAIHILMHLSKNLLETIQQKESAPIKPPSKWMISTLRDLSLLHPSDFKKVDPEHLESEDADRIISYYLAQYEPPEMYQKKQNAKAKKEPKPPKINLDEYPEDIQRCICEYRRLLIEKRKYNLDEAGCEKFIENYNGLLREAEALADENAGWNKQYKELNEASRILRNCTSKAFVYGVLYGGDDGAVKEAAKQYEKDPIGRLQELSGMIPAIITRLSASSVSNKEDVKSIRFEPLDRDVYNLLAELEDICPKYFPDVIEHPTKFFNVADALDVLRRIDHEHALDKLKKELLEAEKAEKKEPENNHEPSNLNAKTSVPKENTPVNIPESTQQTGKPQQENTTKADEEKENQQQPKHTFPFFHRR